jgi:hypothetical protein
MEYIIECPICGEEYARNEHIPLVLSCGHSICKACAQNLQKTFGEIACPLDKKVDSRRITEISYCFTILDLIERVIPLENKLKFLKLTQEQKNKLISEKGKEKIESLDTLIVKNQQKIFEVSDLRDKAIEEIYELFDRVKETLDNRQDEMIEQVKNHTKDTLKLLQIHLDDLVQLRKELQKKIDESLADDAFFDELQKPQNDELVQFNFKIKISDEFGELEKAVKCFGKVHLLSLDFPYECRHYVGITYWVIPQCCKEYYCCNICHDLKENHKWVYAETMVCMKCEEIQQYRKLPNACSFCDYFHKPINLKNLV